MLQEQLKHSSAKVVPSELAVESPLGIAPRAPYAARVPWILRFIGLMNAAAWLGAGIFFTFGIGTAVFSPEMKDIFGDYYPGIIAQILLKRYFTLHLVCGVIALLVLGAEMFYTRRRFQRLTFALFLVPLLIGLFGGWILQPNMRPLHDAKYRAPTADERGLAGQQFGRLHALSSVLNLISLGFLVAYTWRVANPPEPARFVSAHKFRG
jgi:hypothetical protein